MQFAAADHDAVTAPLFNAHISFCIRLVGWSQHPVTLDVCLSAAAHQVFGLEASEPFLEVLMVLGSTVVLLVRFVGNVIDGVGTVYTHAALDAAAHLLAEQTGHVLLFVQVFGAMMDVSIAVDSLTGEMRDGGAQVLVLRPGCFIKSGADGIDAVHLELICAVDQLAVEVEVPLHLGQAFDILLFCSHLSSLLM